MSISHDAPLPSEAGPRLIGFWEKRVREHPEDPIVLAHGLQVLLRAAQEQGPASELIGLAEALHIPMLTQGKLRTWAESLRKLLKLRPELLSLAPQLGDMLLTTWTAYGAWEEAQKDLQTWLTGLEKTSRRWRVMHIYREGNLLWMRGCWQPALRLGHQAWSILTEQEADLRPRIAMLIALSLWRLKRYTEALAWGEVGLRASPPDANPERARLHHYLFLVHLARGDIPHAEEHLRLGLQFFHQLGNHIQIAHLWADSTDFFLAQGQTDQAVVALARAYARWREAEDPYGLADYYRHAARVHFALGNIHLARDEAAYARDCWKALGVPFEVQRCQALLARHPGRRRIFLLKKSD